MSSPLNCVSPLKCNAAHENHRTIVKPPSRTIAATRAFLKKNKKPKSSRLIGLVKDYVSGFPFFFLFFLLLKDLFFCCRIQFLKSDWRGWMNETVDQATTVEPAGSRVLGRGSHGAMGQHWMLMSEWHWGGKRSNGMRFQGCPKLISPAWPGQRWHPAPACRAGATPSCWCCRQRTGEGRCLLSQSPGSGWWRFLHRGPRELWPYPGSSACGSQSSDWGQFRLKKPALTFDIKDFSGLLFFFFFFLPWYSPLQECGWHCPGSRPWRGPYLWNPASRSQSVCYLLLGTWQQGGEEKCESHEASAARRPALHHGDAQGIAPAEHGQDNVLSMLYGELKLLNYHQTWFRFSHFHSKNNHLLMNEFVFLLDNLQNHSPKMIIFFAVRFKWIKGKRRRDLTWFAVFPDADLCHNTLLSRGLKDKFSETSPTGFRSGIYRDLSNLK